MVILPTIDSPSSPSIRQPSRMEFVSYSRVQHALPDGRPDFAAPDNFFVIETQQWFLRQDTDDVPADRDGTRHFHVPAFMAKEYIRYDSLGHAAKSLLSRFKEVNFGDAPLSRAIERGRSSSGEFEADLSEGRRVLYFEIRHVVRRVEIHTAEGDRLVRSDCETHWAAASEGWYHGKPFVPRSQDVMPSPSFSPVQAGPPVLEYGPVMWPKGDDF